MKLPTLDFFPPLLVALALFGAVAVFLSETRSFRDAVSSWVRRELDTRAELAASTLKDAVATEDFRRIHEFGESCTEDGVWLTVFSAPGGVVFDSLGKKVQEGEFMFATHPCGDFRIRLGYPLSRVLVPYRRARMGFLLAGVVGGVGVLFVLLFSLRQRTKVIELARERDAQRRLVEELQKVESFRRDFIADVSHEIKTPLTGIMGSVDLLTSGGNLQLDAKERLLDMLKSESRRLNDLVQGILSLARLERGAAAESVNLTSADITEIVHEVVSRLSLLAKEKGVDIRIDAPEPYVAACDGQLLSNAMSNLLMNAILHSGSSEVRVSLSSSGGSISISVEDHGVGIPHEHRDRVFDRFYRVDSSRDSRTGGTGLGLAIVREIARLHGGTVTLEGVEPSGCRFTFKMRQHAQAV